MSIDSTEEGDFDDSSVFMGSLLPIKLVSDSPNSAYWCRPIFFKFLKENQFSILQEDNAIKAEIDNLGATVIGEMEITHSLLQTMIDGKATAVLCETSSQRCDICKASPKEMNEFPLILTKNVDVDIWSKYGLSVFTYLDKIHGMHSSHII